MSDLAEQLASLRATATPGPYNRLRCDRRKIAAPRHGTVFCANLSNEPGMRLQVNERYAQAYANADLLHWLLAHLSEIETALRRTCDGNPVAQRPPELP